MDHRTIYRLTQVADDRSPVAMKRPPAWRCALLLLEAPLLALLLAGCVTAHSAPRISRAEVTQQRTRNYCNLGRTITSDARADVYLFPGLYFIEFEMAVGDSEIKEFKVVINNMEVASMNKRPDKEGFEFNDEDGPLRFIRIPLEVPNEPDTNMEVQIKLWSEPKKAEYKLVYTINVHTVLFNSNAQWKPAAHGSEGGALILSSQPSPSCGFQTRDVFDESHVRLATFMLSSAAEESEQFTVSIPLRQWLPVVYIGVPGGDREKEQRIEVPPPPPPPPTPLTDCMKDKVEMKVHSESLEFEIDARSCYKAGWREQTFNTGAGVHPLEPDRITKVSLPWPAERRLNPPWSTAPQIRAARFEYPASAHVTLQTSQADLFNPITDPMIGDIRKATESYQQIIRDLEVLQPQWNELLRGNVRYSRHGRMVAGPPADFCRGSGGKKSPITLYFNPSSSGRLEIRQRRDGDSILVTMVNTASSHVIKRHVYKLPNCLTTSIHLPDVPEHTPRTFTIKNSVELNTISEGVAKECVLQISDGSTTKSITVKGRETYATKSGEVTITVEDCR